MSPVKSPSGIRRGLDHIVHMVQDLPAARKLYEALGFTTTPIAQHPFGTANSLVQLQGNFIELLTVDRPELIADAPPGHFSFAAFNRDFLARREGFSMLVFESADARADQTAFAAAGLETYAPFDFSRQATLPDGRQVTVAFSLAFVTDPRLPEAAFFVCQQHAPEHFWKPQYQRHANGARVMSAATLLAEDPPALTDLFAGLQGAEQVRTEGQSLRVETARGQIEVLSPTDWEARFQVSPPAALPATPCLAGIGVTLPDLAAAADILARNGIAHRRLGDRIVIDAETAHGLTIALVESAGG